MNNYGKLLLLFTTVALGTSFLLTTKNAWKIYYYLKRLHVYPHYDRNRIESIPKINLNYPQYSLCEKRFEISFNASGLLLTYQMGFAKALLELANKNKLRQQCYFSGVSGGAGTSAYLMASVFGIGDMDYWYGEHVRNICALGTRKILSHGSLYFWKLGEAYWKICTTAGLLPCVLNDNIQIFTSVLHKSGNIEMKVLNTFNNSASCGDAIGASAFIPLILNRACLMYCNNDLCIDGFVSYSYEKHITQFKKPNTKIINFILLGNESDDNNMQVIEIYDKKIKNTFLGKFIGLLSIVTHSKIELADKEYINGYQNGLKILPNILKKYDLL
jgi:hypothetical protein